MTDDAPPFLSPEFFTLTRPIAGSGRPLVAGARADGHRAGALPLLLEGHKLSGLHSAHTPLYDYRGEPEGLLAIWEALRDDPRWHTLTLTDVPADSLLAKRLPELARDDGCPAVVQPGARHPYFPLKGFEAQLNAHFRANLHRCERKAGGVTLERITHPGRAVLDEALAIEGRAWKDAAGSSIAADERVAHLYRTLSRLEGRRGRASVDFLRVGGERIAVLIAVEDAHAVYALKIGYHPDRASISPGHLLVWKVACDAEQRGLAEFDFVGNDSEWKHRWTDRTHGHVTLVIYRRAPLPLAEWALREVVRPWAKRVVPNLRTPLRRGCQRDDIVGEHTLIERVRGRLTMGLGIRSGLKRVFKRMVKPEPPRDPLGAPSKFAAGSWVRVRDDAQIRATLDEKSRLRGLVFVPSQFHSCRGVFRVDKQVRRLRDDDGRMRPVSGTVLLEGVTCAGFEKTPTGCGRHCPLMFRDEWLEPATAPRNKPPSASTLPHARVRDVEEITAGLDVFGRRDGLTFLPQMAALCGKRVAIVEKLVDVHEHGHWTRTARPLYLLEGVHCSGADVEGGCDRACSLVWHPDWLHLEPPRHRP